MFSLTEQEAAEFWSDLEHTWLEALKIRSCGTAISRKRWAAATGEPERATVLVVEDDDDVRDYATTVLRDAGYDVVPASCPSEALRRLADDLPVDLIFTDIVLPEIDGYKLAELAKVRHPELRVLYTTGHCDTRAPLERYGRVLAKPYRAGQLEAAVREATGVPH